MTKLQTLYNKSPTKCKHCNSSIPYNKRKNKFCDSSCSATYTNSTRNRKYSTPVGVRSFCKVTFTLCKRCNTAYRVISGTSNFCSIVCNPEFCKKATYRTLCKFKLNKKDHLTLFNQQLIKEYGWYVPSNHKKPTNLSGVCWDHLYRISDGYINKVPPNIMSHPANAELVTWPTNIARRISTISYEELLYRITNW